MIAYLGLESQLLSTSEPEIEGANNLKKGLLRLIRKFTGNQVVYNKLFWLYRYQVQQYAISGKVKLT